jgi:transcriptional regulator with XRE-family HTH domain
LPNLPLFERLGYIRNEEALRRVGLQIRKLREEAGMTQQEFADLCDMELSQVNRIELGKINTSVSVLFRMAEVLNISPARFLEVEMKT